MKRLRQFKIFDMHKNKKGIANTLIIGVVVLVLVVAGTTGYFYFNKDRHQESNQNNQDVGSEGLNISENKTIGEAPEDGPNKEYLTKKFQEFKDYFKATEFIGFYERNGESYLKDNPRDIAGIEDLSNAFKSNPNQNYVEFWTEAYCPKSGTEYDYVIPNNLRLVLCEKAETGLHGGCPTCVMSKIALTADFFLGKLSIQSDLVKFSEQNKCEKKAQSINFYEKNISELYTDEYNPSLEPYQGILFKDDEYGSFYSTEKISSILNELKTANLDSDAELKDIFKIKTDGGVYGYDNVKIIRGKFDRCSEDPVILVYSYESVLEEDYTRSYIFLIKKENNQILINQYYSGSLNHYNGYMMKDFNQTSENSPYFFVVSNGGYGSAAAFSDFTVMTLENLHFIPLINFLGSYQEKGIPIFFSAEYSFKDVNNDGEKEFVIDAKQEEKTVGIDGSSVEGFVLNKLEKRVVLKWNESKNNFVVVE